MDTTLYHFTSTKNLQGIVSDGIVRLEGYGIETIVRQINSGLLDERQYAHASGQDIRSVWRVMRLQYKMVGRYVWLTEEDDVRCINALEHFDKVALMFDAQEIGAKRWTDVMRKRSLRSNKARKVIRALNQAARRQGDDITKWWIVEKEIPLALCDKAMLSEQGQVSMTLNQSDARNLTRYA